MCHLLWLQQIFSTPSSWNNHTLVLQEPRWVYDNPLTQAPPTVAVSKGTLIQTGVGILNVLVTKTSTLCTNGLMGQWTRDLHLISRMARFVGPTNANSVHRVWEDMLACLKAWAVPLSWPGCEDLQSQIWMHHKCNYVTALSAWWYEPKCRLIIDITCFRNNAH